MTITNKALSSLKLTDTVVTSLSVDPATVQTNLDSEISRAKAAEQTNATDIDTLEEEIAKLKTDITGISGAMHFRGTATTAPSGTVLPAGVDNAGSAASAGDVVAYGDKEYVFNGSSWAEFGDVSAEGTRLTNLESRMTTAEGEIDTLQSDVTSLKNRVAITQQSAPTALTTGNTVEEMMTRINTIVTLLVSAKVFK